MLFVIVVAAIAATLWFGGRDGGAALPAGGGSSAASARGSAASAAASGLPPGTVATRADASLPTPDDAAALPTACLAIVDHGSRQPVAGAAVRRLQDGAAFGFSDERGLAAIPLAKAAQLAVVSDGYLLRLVPTQPGSSEADPQEVRLVRDAWSVPRRFRFVGPDGAPVAEAFVRFRPDAGATALLAGPGPAGDPVLQRAWHEHLMLATRPVCDDVPVQIVGERSDRVHRLADGAAVHFAAEGRFVLDAATTGGLVGRADVRVAAGPEPAPLEVRLLPGAFVRGRATDLDGRPIAGVELTIQGGDPLGLVATSDADGRFAIGPLSAGEFTLLVRHGLHEPLAQPCQAPADDVPIRLRALARTPLRGRVRARPGLEPIAGATVVWQVGRGAAIAAKTAADGTFELQAVGDVAGRVSVMADGRVPYAELVDPGSPFADYDLLPADTATRLANGMSATLEGVVAGADGLPAAGVTVRWRPARAAAPAGMPGRRVLEGGSLQLPMVVTTKDDGSFVLETDAFGTGRLTLAGADVAGVEAVATAGRSTTGLRIQQ